MTIIEISEKIARAAHENQFRKNGEPYINHSKRVTDNVIKLTQNKLISLTYNLGLWNSDLVENILISAAWLHDVIEDNPKYTHDALYSYFSNEGVPAFIIDIILKAVGSVTRKEGENYLDFILRANKNLIGRYIKMADIEDNLSNLKPGTLRDKYLLAQYILKN